VCTKADKTLATALDAIGMAPRTSGSPVFDEDGPRWNSRFAIEEIGMACVGAALTAASRLHEVRTGASPTWSLDLASLQAALLSERLFGSPGRPTATGFAPQSRFWPASDGWVRTHANYPWHHEALLRALDTDDRSLEAAIASLPAEETERRVFAAGGVAAAVRSSTEWLAHPQGQALAAEPLVQRERLGEAPPRPGRPVTYSANGVTIPAAGIRVLDLTRVIAGPVCSRYLGALGAEVLRLDPPRLQDLPAGEPADSLLGKRSAFLDLGSAAGARRLEALLGDADIVVVGYRPGSLAGFGLRPKELAQAHPGIVVIELAAWGHTGPWAERRGFDSIVQAAVGIADTEADDGEPGALPCQLLDHGTGYLAAAAALAALADQRSEGGSHHCRLSLARTAHWLLDEPRTDSLGKRAETPSLGRSVVSLPAPAGDLPLAAVPPPGSLAGTRLRWEVAPARYGADPPVWRE
jgi:crotonobetainyl-CoA:carnitine CoA-transferase CaiB-like acyl-CoA transferase